MIRKCVKTDFSAILHIFDKARSFMSANGNPTQWGGEYPGLEELERDYTASSGFVIEREGLVIAYCALRPGPEPCYQVIQDGEWPDELPYITVHRVASDGSAHGIFREILDFCTLLPFPRIRIDTHENNVVMKDLLERFGFTRCGVIYVPDGTPRTAFIRKNVNRVQDF